MNREFYPGPTGISQSGYIQHPGDDNDVRGLTCRQLWQGAHQVAAALQQSGIQAGETVAIILPTGPDYLCFSDPFSAFPGFNLPCEKSATGPTRR